MEGSGATVLAACAGPSSGSDSAEECEADGSNGVAAYGDSEMASYGQLFRIRVRVPLTVPVKTLPTLLRDLLRLCFTNLVGLTRRPGYLQPTGFVHSIPESLVWIMLVCRAAFECTECCNALDSIGILPRTVGPVILVVRPQSVPKLRTLVLVVPSAWVSSFRLCELSRTSNLFFTLGYGVGGRRGDAGCVEVEADTAVGSYAVVEI